MREPTRDRSRISKKEDTTHIHYYTPAPLNLASNNNNKQQQQQATRLLSVSVITSPQRLGLHTTLAILEPRWCPCQIQFLRKKKFHRWHPGARAPSQGHFVPKTAFSCPKKSNNLLKSAKRRETVGTLHVRLDFFVSKTHLVPSNSTTCPRNTPQKA